VYWYATDKTSFAHWRDGPHRIIFAGVLGCSFAAVLAEFLCVKRLNQGKISIADDDE
jgi:hypothetical protein